MPDTERDISERGIPQIRMTVSPSQNVQTPVDDTLSIPEMAADAKATGDAINNVAADLSDLAADVAGITDGLLESIYPVGALYMTTAGTMPEALSALGTWTEVSIPLTWGDIKHGTRSYGEPDGESGTIHFWLRTA